MFFLGEGRLNQIRFLCSFGKLIGNGSSWKSMSMHFRTSLEQKFKHVSYLVILCVVQDIPLKFKVPSFPSLEWPCLFHQIPFLDCGCGLEKTRKTIMYRTISISYIIHSFCLCFYYKQRERHSNHMPFLYMYIDDFIYFHVYLAFKLTPHKIIYVLRFVLCVTTIKITCSTVSSFTQRKKNV